MSNNSEKLVKDIRRRTRKKYSSEEKIRIVLEGMRGRRKYRRAVSSGRIESKCVLPLE